MHRKRTHHKEKEGVEVLVQQVWKALNSKHVISCYWKVSGEINARHDIFVNNLLKNIIIQRRFFTNKQTGAGDNCPR